MEKQMLPKDSGTTREFSTGAHRDAAIGKGRCDLLPLHEVASVMNDPVVEALAKFIDTHDENHIIDAIKKSKDIIPEYQGSLAHMMIEVSMLYEAGALKYGENNWKRGMPLKCYIDSGLRHYFKTLRGDDDEPHYRGFLWNMLCAIWTIRNVDNPFDGFEVVE
jgi:hypothetical protein